MPYRMFVDEVGNADLRSSSDANHQYLSLTGIIVDMSAYWDGIDKQFSDLKQSTFGRTDVIFHRREILDRTPPFDIFKDEAKRDAFSKKLLIYLETLDYVALTVAIDKKAHREKYGKWQYYPYHYCMVCLLERYVKYLHRKRSTGDVMAESRNRSEDEKLKQAYSRFWKHGSSFVSDRERLDCLSSRELKLQKKSANINGLQLADLVASPSFRWMLCSKTKSPMTAVFGKAVAEILKDKYDTGNTGVLDGYGCKWLP